VVRRFDPDTTPFLRALDTLRRVTTRQGEHREHVTTIIATIDQYAEAAVGDRLYFCDQPNVTFFREPTR
jgi:hypothetical protein